MLGKDKCRILKEIRQRIADENDIPYVTRECTYQGACRGTCPKCESELRYLEQQLAKRQALGKRIAVAALCAGLAFGGAACGPVSAPSASTVPDSSPSPSIVPDPSQTPEIFVTEGEIAWQPTEGEPTPEPLEGMAMPEPTPGQGDEEWELEGDVVFLPEPTLPGNDNG